MGLLPVAVSAYGLQAVFAAIFVPRQDDRFYDFCGALGWLSTVAFSLYYPAFKARFYDGGVTEFPALSSFPLRQLALSAAVTVWSLRLGAFLVQRSVKAGGDSRFEKIKTNPRRFTILWMVQGTWIFVVGMPVWLAGAPIQPTLGLSDYAGILLTFISFLIEVEADRQKTAWRKAKERQEHSELFISSGLWSISRHPNYVGEMGIWTGIWLLSFPALWTSQHPLASTLLASLGPLLTYRLLRKVSGVPILEKAADDKWGDNHAWNEYKRTVPVFWPWMSVYA